MFEAGQMVDVTGQSKGKGFAGTIKRWNFRWSRTTRTVTLCRTVFRVPLVRTKRQAGYFQAKKWLVIWVLYSVLPRIWKWYV